MKSRSIMFYVTVAAVALIAVALAVRNPTVRGWIGI